MYKNLILIFTFTLFFSFCSDNKNAEHPDIAKPKLSELDTFYGGNTMYCVSDTDINYFNSIYKIKTDTSESNCIKAQNGWVERNGDTLLLKINGQMKAYVNDSKIESDSYTEYHFITKLNEINYYLLKVYFYEAFSYLLVNANNGKETYLCGYPAIAPDKSKLIAGCFDLQAGFVFNGLQLFSITPDSLKLNWNRELTKWGTDHIAWVDDNTLVAEQITVDSTMNTKTSYIKFTSCK